MKVLLLAAGRGERMQALTANLPKPLIEVAGRPLIEHQIERLRRAGFTDLVVNLGYLGHLIEARLGDGRGLGVRIAYSDETGQVLGTGGAIRKAMALLGPSPVLVTNADLWTDFPYARLRTRPAGADIAHLVLAPNPAHVPQGDFSLAAGRIGRGGAQRLTFTGIGVYLPAIFAGPADDVFSLVRPVDVGIVSGAVSGERYDGEWTDVGTPERLAEVRARATGA